MVVLRKMVVLFEWNNIFGMEWVGCFKGEQEGNVKLS